jgi:hypothetical protein
MSEDILRDLFVIECMQLETFIKGYISTGFSDREVLAVISRIVAEIILKQENPNGAFAQYIDAIKDYLI